MFLKYVFPAIILTIIIHLGSSPAPEQALREGDYVSDLLEKLGKPALPHKPDFSIEGVSAEKGEELVRLGFTEKPGGGKTGRQSKHFVCTACHNVVKDDPTLRFKDPEVRLDYAIEHDIPYVQGSSLYGAVNRTHFYNGDYEKKYGELVTPARDNIREAIQLCAVECSQGRRLKDWELESILAYLWTIGLRVEDLELSDRQMQAVEDALNGRGNLEHAVELIESRYASGAPATFIDPPKNRKEGYPELTGRVERGKAIYELGCLHCHESGRYAFFKLDRSKLSTRFLERHIDRYTRYSIYQVARYGTSPMPGKSTYMPQYTLEKMNQQQLEDLKAFLEQD
jgi:mono/diheme cytochrome c family protein